MVPVTVVSVLKEAPGRQNIFLRAMFGVRVMVRMRVTITVRVRVRVRVK